jgi:hypothetical protein
LAGEAAGRWKGRAADVALGDKVALNLVPGTPQNAGLNSMVAL